MDSIELRRIAGHFATGVVVVTSSDVATGAMHGVTVNSFTSVSLDPPLVLVCIAQSSQSHDFLSFRPQFAVNILARRQTALAERFAGRAPLVGVAFEGLRFALHNQALPLLDGCVAWLTCRRIATHPGGDHSIVVGEVLDGHTGEDDDPLVFFQGGYTSLNWG